MKFFVTTSLLFTLPLAAQKLTYEDHILPILENSCTNCHNPDKRKADLDLTNFQGLMAGSSGGKIVIAGDGASSKLFTTSSHLAEPFMPPKGDRLEAKELNLIRSWIDEGLRETKDSKAQKSNAPKIDFSKFNTAKPSGPPPLPVATMNTDPVMRSARAGNVARMIASPWAPLVAITGQKQVLLYNTQNMDLVAVLPFSKKGKNIGNPESLSFHPSGKYLTAGGGIQGKSGTTITWDITTGKQIMTVAREYDSVIASSIRADLKSVATGGPSKLVKIWQTSDNSLITKIKKHTDWVTHMAHSPDGTMLATADRNGGVYMWEADTGNPLHSLLGHKKAISSLRWSPDSKLLVSASEDGSLRLWSMDSGKSVRQGANIHGGGILAMDWSKNGNLVTVGRDKMMKVLRSNFSVIKQIKYPHAALPTRICWSHDSSQFITADFQGNVIVWDAKSYKETARLSANPSPLRERIAVMKAILTKQEVKVAAVKQTFTKATQNKKKAITERDKANQARNIAKGTIKIRQQQIRTHQQQIKHFRGKHRAENQQLQKAKRGLHQCVQQGKQLKTKLSQLEAKFNKLPKPPTNEQATPEQKKQAKQAENLSRQIQQVKKQIVDLNKRTQPLVMKEKEALQKVAHLQLSIKQNQQAIPVAQKQIQQAQKVITDSTNKFNHHQRQIKPLTDAENKAKVAYEKIAKTLVPLQQKLARLNARVKK